MVDRSFRIFLSIWTKATGRLASSITFVFLMCLTSRT
ncbi:UNVERIFIED_ORG: hypothetical protein J2740_002471 [Rhizobium nepotum]|nr:hypothetical protein [Rhizobium nepotum]